MTQVGAPLPCEVCGGILLPEPLLFGGQALPPGIDYVCDDCGRPYAWQGTPPDLVLVENLLFLRPRKNGEHRDP